MILYTDFISLIDMLFSITAYGFTALDGMQITTLPSDYILTGLDAICGFIIVEETWSFIMSMRE